MGKVLAEPQANPRHGDWVPFHRPHVTGNELGYIAQAIERRELAEGAFTRKCQAWLEQDTGAARAVLTHSCTAALEMAALLLDLEPGDEIVMPSYTFVSTANAFVLRGGVPVFVDVRPDTLNIDERAIEAALTKKTRAICAVHYAGVACNIEDILAIAQRHGIAVIEDAAHGCVASKNGRRLGTFGTFGALSFHETKNIIAGQGGALLVNDPAHADRADVLCHKGTNRQAYIRREVEKYSWVDIGSSFLPGELAAAFLWAQLEAAYATTERHLAIWDRYYQSLARAEAMERVRRPIVPSDCMHNAHMFQVLLPTIEHRTRAITALAERGIEAVFHYTPLHASPAGVRFGRSSGSLDVTTDVAGRILRLPLWDGLPDSTFEIVAETLEQID